MCIYDLDVILWWHCKAFEMGIIGEVHSDPCICIRQALVVLPAWQDIA